MVYCIVNTEAKKLCSLTRLSENSNGGRDIFAIFVLSHISGFIDIGGYYDVSEPFSAIDRFLDRFLHPMA